MYWCYVRVVGDPDNSSRFEGDNLKELWKEIYRYVRLTNCFELVGVTFRIFRATHKRCYYRRDIGLEII